MVTIILLLLIGIYFIPYPELKTLLVSVLSYLWFFLVPFVIYYVYKNKLKPYKTKFNEKVLNKLPSFRSPAELNCLLSGKLKPNDLSASFMELIRKRAFIIKRYQNDDNFFFVFNKDMIEELTKSESFLLTWFLNRIGNGESVSLRVIMKDAKYNSSYFYSCYQDWYELAVFEGTKQSFYERKSDILEKSFVFFAIAIFLAILNILVNDNIIIMLFLVSISFLVESYIYYSKRRTIDANEEYIKWMAFKQYLEEKDAFSEENDFIYLERCAVYSKSLKKLDVFRKTLKKKYQDDLEIVNNSVLLAIVRNGMMRYINRKLEKAIFVARIKAFFMPVNKGSNAVHRYKGKKEGNREVGLDAWKNHFN